MKMDSKKGFTLIELLAVIVILAVIATITIPLLLNVINKVRSESYKRSVEFAIDATDYYLIEKGLDNIPSEGISVKDLKLKNNNFESGKIKVDSSGNVVAENVSNREYCASGEKGKLEVSKGNCGSSSESETGNGNSYVDSNLKGNDPKIVGDLIAVTIDNNGVVKKADTSKEWYNYDKQEWANAVILTDDGRIESDGTIKEDSIKGYFVWIPRYRYKLFNVGTGTVSPQEIVVEFQSMEDDVDNGTNKGDWLTHPAFTTMGVSGFWVGKFGTTGTLDNITVKPNRVYLMSFNFKFVFEASYNFDRNLNSHMIKNTEWGAVAYLSHSKYGKWGNQIYNSGNKQIYPNDSIYATGRSSGSTSSNSGYNGTYNWNETEDRGNGQGAAGAGASTTGNITGVYDMAGGGYTWVAGYNDFGETSLNNLTQAVIDSYGKQYFDVYKSGTSSSDYSRRILGDATAETKDWYQLTHSFVYKDYLLFSRYDLFGFSYEDEDQSDNERSRLVLSP